MSTSIQRTIIAAGIAATMACSSFALADAATDDMIHRVKVELSQYPGLSGGFKDGVVTLSGNVDSKTDIDKIKKIILEIDGVDEVISTIEANG